MWELEERHLQEKHQQLKQQLKDQYFLQRHQLLKRHEKVLLAQSHGHVTALINPTASDFCYVVNLCECGLCRKWSRCNVTTND